jgi:hypothetical protein
MNAFCASENFEAFIVLRSPRKKMRVKPQFRGLVPGIIAGQAIGGGGEAMVGAAPVSR